MGDESQRYFSIKQAICIKAYRNQGICFEVDTLDIVIIEPDRRHDPLNFSNTALILVKNKKGSVWYFVRNIEDIDIFKTTPKLSLFSDHFKELK